MSPTPGVVSGLGLILQATTAPGDEVVVFPPAYPPSAASSWPTSGASSMRSWSDRRPLRHGPRRPTQAADARTKVVFCSPHNPGGTVWSADEIRALARFCAEHDLLLVSDEIHCDLVFAGAKHTPTITAAPRSPTA